MSSYLENVIKGSGGLAAPVENLELPEDYSEQFLEFGEEDLTFISEIQELDDNSEFDDYDPIISIDSLIPEEKDLADSLLRIVAEYGKFNDDNTGVWAGYTSAEENAENAAIGVKCGNCVFYDAPKGCSIIVAEVEDGGLCRFAVLPDGTVTATAGSKAAPKKDQIKGSSKNKKGSAGSGKGVAFSKKIEESLSKKVREHNEKAKDGRKTSLRTLKAVYRRGAGAFSTSHRPDQNRNSWAMARVNAFLKLLKSGKPSNLKYTTDNDLLPSSHPKASKTASAAISAAAASEIEVGMSLELASDPCWDGYIQVGTKEKNGKEVPNCVPSSATINYLIDDINSTFGVSRHVSKEAAYEVARKAYDKYSYLSSCEDIHSAIMWELHTFAEYATTGLVAEGEDFSMYADLLSEGHPDIESSLVASLLWVSGAPELDNSGRQVLINAFSNESDYVDSLHSSTRLKVLISSGSLSEATTNQLKAAVQRYQQVD